MIAQQTNIEGIDNKMAVRPGVILNSIRVWLLSMPLTTRIVLSFIAICFFFSTSLTCLSPTLVIYSFQGDWTVAAR